MESKRTDEYRAVPASIFYKYIQNFYAILDK